jgi:hypothetical protein
MLRLDQLGDDLCDSLGQLQFVRVEVHPEISPLDPFHGSSASPGTKICRASTIPTETGLFPVM